MYYKLGDQREKVREAFPRKMPESRSGKINVAAEIVSEFARPCGSSDIHVFYVAAGVIICESKNADDFIRKFDKFTQSL